MWGTYGTAQRQFKYPQGVAVNSSGNIFVVDGGNNRIQKFSSAGNFIRTWGVQGTGAGQFGFPVYLDITNTGTVVLKEYVYVADVNNNRIQVFTWKPDVQPADTNLNLKGYLQNNNNTGVTSK
jgi:hypothetical protein